MQPLRIPLTQDAYALIEPTDLELVDQYDWHLSDTGYAVWRGIKDGKKQTIRMHRLITGAKDGEIVDHINHNRLDNRRFNLRIASQSANMRNMKDQGKGYWYHTPTKKWAVDINGLHRGLFDTEVEAMVFAGRVRLGLAYKKPKVAKTHCKYGHSMVDAYRYKGTSPICKKCQKERSQNYYKRKQESKI